MRSVALVAALGMAACGGDDDGTSGTDGHILVGSAVGTVVLPADTPVERTFDWALPGSMDRPAEVTVDLEATLPYIQLVRTDGNSSTVGPQLDITVKVATAEDAATVCDDGVMAGQAILTGDDDYNLTGVSPASISTDAASIETVSARSGTLCVEGISTVDAELTISEIVLAVTEDSECEVPALIDGVWDGTYACTNSCGEGSSDTIDLEVFQQGHLAAYTADSDPEAPDAVWFAGTVCGNQFNFARVTPGEIETGVFTLLDENTAVKTSHWESEAGDCSGDCEDNLTRVGTARSRSWTERFPALGFLAGRVPRVPLRAALAGGIRSALDRMSSGKPTSR